MSVKKGSATPSKHSLNERSSRSLHHRVGINVQETVKAPSFGTRLLASTVFTCFIVLLTIVLICGAAAMFHIYHSEEKITSAIVKAVLDIREVMKIQNASNALKSDPEILVEARKLLDVLITKNKRNEWVENEIKPITRLLYAGWKGFQGYLYFASGPVLTHYKAREECEKRKAALVFITQPEEEDFVERLVQPIANQHWIGLHLTKLGNEYEWQWLNGEKPIRSYWLPGQPTNPSGNQNLCGAIARWCSTRRRCWNAVSCQSWQNWVCKMPPNPELFD